MILFHQLLYCFGVGTFIVPFVNSQIVTSTLTSNQPVCPGQTVSFTCVTRGSPTIAWVSDEYIERRGPGLQFNKLSVPNSSERSPVNSNTVAFFVSNTVDNGIDVLESKLRIVVLSKFSTASVTCVHGNGSRKVETFRVLDDPDMLQDMAYDQIEVRKDEYHRCIIQASWSAPTNIDVTDVREYMMFVNGTNIVNKTSTNNQKLTLGSYSMCACATHRVNVKVVNRCGRASISTNVTILDPPSRPLAKQDCGDSVYITTQSRNDDITDAQFKSDNPDPCVSLIVACVLLSVLAASFLVSTFVLAVLYGRELKKQKLVKVEAKNPLPTPMDNETKVSPL